MKLFSKGLIFEISTKFLRKDVGNFSSIFRGRKIRICFARCIETCHPCLTECKTSFVRNLESTFEIFHSSNHSSSISRFFDTSQCWLRNVTSFYLGLPVSFWKFSFPLLIPCSRTNPKLRGVFSARMYGADSLTFSSRVPRKEFVIGQENILTYFDNLLQSIL